VGDDSGGREEAESERHAEADPREPPRAKPICAAARRATPALSAFSSGFVIARVDELLRREPGADFAMAAAGSA
jgi:hypothetical protein